MATTPPMTGPAIQALLDSPAIETIDQSLALSRGVLANSPDSDDGSDAAAGDVEAPALTTGRGYVAIADGVPGMLYTTMVDVYASL